MVLSDEKQVDKYPVATMEIGDSALENLYYSNLDNYRKALPVDYPADTTTKPNNYAADLSSADGSQKIGPGIVMKVMAGDQFSIQASSYYNLHGNIPGTPQPPVSDLVTALISGIGALPGGHPSMSMLQSNSGIVNTSIGNFLTQKTDPVSTAGKPHAFINWILFDNQFNYVAAISCPIISLFEIRF